MWCIGMNTYMCIYRVTHLSSHIFIYHVCYFNREVRWQMEVHSSLPRRQLSIPWLARRTWVICFTSTHLQGSLLGRWGGMYHVNDGILLAVFLNACYLIFLVNHFVDLSLMSWANPTMKMLKGLVTAINIIPTMLSCTKPQPSQINNK